MALPRDVGDAEVSRGPTPGLLLTSPSLSPVFSVFLYALPCHLLQRLFTTSRHLLRSSAPTRTPACLSPAPVGCLVIASRLVPTCVCHRRLQPSSRLPLYLSATSSRWWPGTLLDSPSAQDTTTGSVLPGPQGENPCLSTGGPSVRLPSTRTCVVVRLRLPPTGSTFTSLFSPSCLSTTPTCVCHLSSMYVSIHPSCVHNAAGMWWVEGSDDGPQDGPSANRHLGCSLSSAQNEVPALTGATLLLPVQHEGLWLEVRVTRIWPTKGQAEPAPPPLTPVNIASPNH